MPSLESDGRGKASRVAKRICCLQPCQRICSKCCGRLCSKYSTRCECRVIPALFRSHGKLHISHTKQAVDGIFGWGSGSRLYESSACFFATFHDSVCPCRYTSRFGLGAFSPRCPSTSLVAFRPRQSVHCDGGRQDPIVSNGPPIPSSRSILCIINRPSFRSSKVCQLQLISMVLHCQ
jgi:hypothetical protein